MGCTSSSSASATPGPTRNTTTTVSVQSHIPSRPQARPLQQSVSYRNGSPITVRELTQQRNEFWATRTEGNAVMWQNIRSAAEALIAQDLGLASAILEASNIVTTTGSLEVCYDERGAQYKVPLYCIANPLDLATSQDNVPTATSVTAVESSPSDNGRITTAPKIVNAVPLQLRVRINPGDINLMVNADSACNIAGLKKSIVQQSLQSAEPIPEMEEDRQRIIFMGRELQNAQLLGELGIDEQKVVQVFLRPKK